MLIVIVEICICLGQYYCQVVFDQFVKIILIVLQEVGCYGYVLLVDYVVGVSFQIIVFDFIVMVEQWESVVYFEVYL